MGNQTSQPSNEFQKQFYQLKNQLKNQQYKQSVDLNRLQQQIYHTQLKMQELKRQQPIQSQQQHRPQNQPSQQYRPSQPPQPQQPLQQPQQPQLQLPPQQSPQQLTNLLNTPDIKNEMISNPAFGVQIIELILKEVGPQISDVQYQKINEYLERANQQTANTQIVQQTMKPMERYQSEEEMERRKFEAEQMRQRKLFEEQQQRRREEYKKQMQSFEQSKVNPYVLLGVPQNYTMEQLKNAYRKKALIAHPDKGGNPKLFDDLTKAYFSLLEKLKEKEDDKQFMDLKSNSNDYLEKQRSENKQNVSISKEKFNVTAFNKIFEDNRISDPSDNGYQDWLKNDNAREPPKVFSTKFNIDNFNTMFENWKDTDEELGKEIVLSEGPQALMAFHGKTGFVELGVDRIDDFTHADPNSRNLGYTDLKQAYSRNGIINTKAITPRESYRNVEDYERARASKLSYQMSPEEIRQQEIKKRREQEEEERRIQRVQQRDNTTFSSYNRVHQMMIDKLK
jgi:hypothetical protein